MWSGVVWHEVEWSGVEWSGVSVYSCHLLHLLLQNKIVAVFDHPPCDPVFDPHLVVFVYVNVCKSCWGSSAVTMWLMFANNLNRTHRTQRTQRTSDLSSPYLLLQCLSYSRFHLDHVDLVHCITRWHNIDMYCNAGCHRWMATPYPLPPFPNLSSPSYPHSSSYLLSFWNAVIAFLSPFDAPIRV